MNGVKTKKLSFLLKILTIFCSLGGVIISLINAKYDGYSHWSKRLTYFTAQSNIWLGLTFISLLISNAIKVKYKIKNFLYLLKFAFTVSITVTAIVFCSFLAPFADESYHVWSISGFLTHVFAPLFAIVDFFYDDYKIPLTNKRAYIAIIPPALYVLACAFLTAFNFDFGRGYAYPYFFMNYLSPTGFFGFSKEPPFFVGYFYWIILFALITYSLAILYTHLKLKKPRLR